MFLQEILTDLAIQKEFGMSQSFFIKGSVSTKKIKFLSGVKTNYRSRNPFLLKVLFLHGQIIPLLNKFTIYIPSQSFFIKGAVSTQSLGERGEYT